VPAAVTLLKARHARLNVSIDVGSSKQLVERLRAGDLDIVIGRGVDGSHADQIHIEPNTPATPCQIVGWGPPQRGARGLDLADLARQAWIVPPAGSMVRDRIASLFLTQGHEQPAETVSTAELPVQTALLLGSDMVAPMSVELVKPYLDSGLLAVLPYELNLRMDVYGIITRRHHQLSPAAEAMLGALRETATRPKPTARVTYIKSG
jgi:DNA-binding transcriptional LysR family regulator